MGKIFLLFTMYTIVFVSIAFNQNEHILNDKKNRTTLAEIANDTSHKASETVIIFLQWYRKNYETIGKIKLVNNLPNDEDYDSTKHYSVNRDGIDKYLDCMKSSGYLSSKYIDYWKEKFIKGEEYLEKEPMIDEMPPNGFDYDFVLLTQEMDYVFKMLDKAKIKYENIIDNAAEVHLAINEKWIYDYRLSYDGKKWLIDSIDYLK